MHSPFAVEAFVQDLIRSRLAEAAQDALAAQLPRSGPSAPFRRSGRSGHLGHLGQPQFTWTSALDLETSAPQRPAWAHLAKPRIATSPVAIAQAPAGRFDARVMRTRRVLAQVLRAVATRIDPTACLERCLTGNGTIAGETSLLIGRSR